MGIRGLTRCVQRLSASASQPVDLQQAAALAGGEGAAQLLLVDLSALLHALLRSHAALLPPAQRSTLYYRASYAWMRRVVHGLCDRLRQAGWRLILVGKAKRLVSVYLAWLIVGRCIRDRGAWLVCEIIRLGL